MSANIFNTQQYIDLCKEYETIEKIVPYRGDKFAVKKGTLIITKGGYLQSATRFIKNLIHGGYNRDAVVNHIEQIGAKTHAFVIELKKDPNYLTHSSNELRQFSKKVRNVATALSEVEFVYRDMKAFPAYKDQTCKKLSAQFDVFNDLGQDLKKELKSSNAHAINKTQKTPIDFTGPINLKKIKFTLPSTQTPQDTLKLAKNAQSQIIPLWKKVSVVTLAIFATLVVGLPLIYLNGVKWVLWNPVELAIKGKITTQNPMDWWTNTTRHVTAPYFAKDAERALNRYAHQLLRTPIISDEHVSAFCELSHHIDDEIDFYFHGELASKNIEELWSMVEADKFNESVVKSQWGKYALEAIEELVNKSTMTMIQESKLYRFLYINRPFLTWIDNGANERMTNKKCIEFLTDYKNSGYEDTAENRKRYFVDRLLLDNPFNQTTHKRSKYRGYISPSNLCKVIAALGKKSHCRKISIPLDAEKMKDIQNALKEYGFVQSSEYKGTYLRKR